MRAAQQWLTCPTVGFTHWASSRDRPERWRVILDSEPWTTLLLLSFSV